MGDCYATTLTIPKMTRARERDLIKKIACKIIDDTYSPKCNINYSLDDFAKEGVNLLSLDGLMRVILAGWKKNQFSKRIENGEIIYNNGFDASYGWGSVMCAMFEHIANKLPNGATFTIDSDETNADYEIVGKELVEHPVEKPQFYIGDEVCWNDPDDDKCSGKYIVKSYDGESYTLVQYDDKGEISATVEAYEDEMEHA